MGTHKQGSEAALYRTISSVSKLLRFLAGTMLIFRMPKSLNNKRQ